MGVTLCRFYISLFNIYFHLTASVKQDENTIHYTVMYSFSSRGPNLVSKCFPNYNIQERKRY